MSDAPDTNWDDDDEPEGWLCDCGRYQPNDGCCDSCGGEPPWGMDEDDEDDWEDDWLDDDEDEEW